jgi:hypothetical protein
VNGQQPTILAEVVELDTPGLAQAGGYDEQGLHGAEVDEIQLA